MDYNTVVSLLQQGNIVRYANAAGVVILLYDVVLTMRDEIRLVWHARPSLAKYLYFMNRYSVAALFIFHAYIYAGFHAALTDQRPFHIVCLTSDEGLSCERYLYGFILFDILEGAGVVLVLLLLRVYALYYNVRGITIILILLWLGYTTPLLVVNLVVARTYYSSPGTVTYNSFLGMCAGVGRPPWLWIEWLFMVLTESIICAMITYKTSRHMQSSINTPLLTRLFRDGVLYYAVMLVSNTVNLVAYRAFSDVVFPFWPFPNWCLTSLLISRIYLNLRGVNSPADWSRATAVQPKHAFADDVAVARLRQERRNNRHVFVETSSSWSDESEWREV